MESVKEQIQLLEQLCSRLEGIYEMLGTRQDVKAEQFIKLIEVMNMKDKYFTQEQIEKMKKPFSPEKRKEIENEWSEFISKVHVECEKGTPPENLDVNRWAKRWNEFINTLTGGDPEFTQAAERYYGENADKFGVEKQLYEYIKKALSNI